MKPPSWRSTASDNNLIERLKSWTMIADDGNETEMEKSSDGWNGLQRVYVRVAGSIDRVLVYSSASSAENTTPRIVNDARLAVFVLNAATNHSLASSSAKRA